MRSIKKSWAAVGAALALGLTMGLGAAPAVAQDINSAAHYGDVRLRAGFTPDPHLTALRAGGSIDAQSRFGSCRGYISGSPDVRLWWDGGGSLDLKISAVSNADVTLVINGPNGEWYCDDDSGEGTNPSVTLKPAAGRYEIWVGVYSSGAMQPAALAISEVFSF